MADPIGDPVRDAFAAVVSHASVSGYFERVCGYEPTSKGPPGLQCAIWADALGPATGSGLSSTSALLVLFARIEAAAFVADRVVAEQLDPKILAATSHLIAKLMADLTLGGVARTVDVRGMSGRRLEARAGYIEVDRSFRRIMTLTVPIIINDLWNEAH
jgi:hypothetical protein